jgi:flagellar biosynthesis/type III secretory pathway chaperone
VEAVENMTREQLVEELMRVRNKKQSLLNKLQGWSKDQLCVEIIRLRGKHRAHRKSLIDQQKAIIEKNARIKALEAQLGALALPKAVEQPDTGTWSAPKIAGTVQC